jgi:hypothetical protein
VDAYLGLIAEGPGLAAVEVEDAGHSLGFILGASRLARFMVRSDDALRVDLQSGRPFLPPATSAVGFDIFLLGKEELEKADPSVFARLVNAQQDEVVRKPLLPHLAVRDLPVIGKRPNQ